MGLSAFCQIPATGPALFRPVLGATYSPKALPIWLTAYVLHAAVVPGYDDAALRLWPNKVAHGSARALGMGVGSGTSSEPVVLRVIRTKTIQQKFSSSWITESRDRATVLMKGGRG